MSVGARVFVVGTVLALLGGAVWGFVRGIDTPRTVAFAVVEGALLVGVPGVFVSALVAGIVTGIARLRR